MPDTAGGESHPALKISDFHLRTHFVCCQYQGNDGTHLVHRSETGRKPGGAPLLTAAGSCGRMKMTTGGLRNRLPGKERSRRKEQQEKRADHEDYPDHK